MGCTDKNFDRYNELAPMSENSTAKQFELPTANENFSLKYIGTEEAKKNFLNNNKTVFHDSCDSVYGKFNREH